MAEITIDLSGRKGLSNGHAGDYDMVTPRPNLRAAQEEGQFVAGLFNPFLREGYLAPTTTTTVSVSSPDTLTEPFKSVTIDNVNSEIYWSGNNHKIYKLSSLTDLSLAVDTTLDTNTFIHDIEMYEINGVPSLVYLYDYPADTLAKKNCVFVGYKSLTSDNTPTIAQYDPISAGSVKGTWSITPTTSSKLGQPLREIYFSNGGLETKQLTDVWLPLKRSTPGQAQTWTMKLSIQDISAPPNTTADGETNYKPSGTVIASSTVAASVLGDDFSMVRFTFSSPVTFPSTTFFIVLEADVPGDLTGNEGLEWLAGDANDGSLYNGLLFSGGGWYHLDLAETYSFGYRVGLNSSQNILPVDEFTHTVDKTTIEFGSIFSATQALGNISTPITVGTLPNNVVVVSIALKSASDQITGVTINGDAMTRLLFTNPVAGTGFYVYYRYGCDTGTVTLATTGSTSDVILAGQIFYNVQPSSISVGASYLETGINDEVNEMFRELFIGDRDVGVFAACIEWREIIGPDFIRITPNSWFTYPVPTDSTTPRLSEAEPLYYSFWEGTTETSRELRGSAMLGRYYNNGVLDYIDWLPAYGIMFKMSPTTQPVDETSTYWTLRGQRSGRSFMRLADNGFAYLFTDRAVHKLDGGITGGGVGSITRNVLQFPEIFSITDALDYRSLLYIAVHQYPVDITSNNLGNYPGKCGVYVWNRISTQLSNADFIELPGVREIKKIYASPSGVVMLIVVAENGITELRRFGYNDSGGVVFTVVRKLGLGAFPNTPDGLKTSGDKVVWLADNGYMYAEKDTFVVKLHEIVAPGTSASSLEQNISGGAVCFASGNETGDAGYRSNKQGILMSYKQGSTVTNEKIYPFDLKTGSNGNQTPHIGDVYTGVSYVPITSDVKRIRIYNAPISLTGTEVVATVKIYFNQGTSAVMPNGMTKTITRNEAKRGYVDFNISKQYVHSVQIEVEWATDAPLSEDTYLPSVAVVSYDLTTTKSPDNG